MYLSYVLLLTLATCLCLLKSAKTSPPGRRRLFLDESSQDRLKGTYLTKKGRRMEFDSDGKQHVDIWLDHAPLLHSHQKDDGKTEITLERTTFGFFSNGTQLPIRQHGEESADWQLEAKKRGDYKLLEELSRALAQRGLKGHENQPALGLFRLSQVVVLALGGSGESGGGSRVKRGWWTKKAPPPPPPPECDVKPGKECFGMCGRGCTCWKWVCGDCCRHEGCFEHDVCCTQHGYFSKECLAVFPFSCDGSKYKYQYKCSTDLTRFF
eukprot:m.306754 g.306754  ORF g.306754 m.306754 type:complete len:267 (+) comp41563_c0_seq1:974-1774(+)